MSKTSISHVGCSSTCLLSLIFFIPARSDNFVRYLCLSNIKDAVILYQKFVELTSIDTPLSHYVKFLLETVQCVLHPSVSTRHRHAIHSSHLTRHDAGPLFEMLNRRYQPSLSRDPTFEKVRKRAHAPSPYTAFSTHLLFSPPLSKQRHLQLQYLQKIGKDYFGTTPPPASGLGGMLSGLMSSFMRPSTTS